MEYDIVQIGAATAATVAPFAPFLVEAGKVGGQKLVEVIAEKGGEAAWQKAQALWGKLSLYFGDDPEVTSMATLVAIRPEDEARQKMLAEVISTRLQESPELAQELFYLMGGREAVQEVVAGHSGWIEDINQKMRGQGTQSVKAGDEGVIKGVTQEQS